MSAQHTPGPWVDVKGTTTGRIVAAPDQPKVRYSVASCGGPNRDANARLIAAAPELLRCAEILAALECEDGGRCFPTKQDCQFARAAIAKATGAA